MPLTDHRPHGALRAFLRAPIALYRAGLGWMFGHRLLYLVHTGRKTGKRRETVLEVVAYDPHTPEAIVVAGWGERSDWYRNITAAPALEVRVGTHRWPHPRQRPLSAEDTLRVLLAYRDRHPRAWRRIAPMLGLPTDLAAQDDLARIPAIAFTPYGTPRGDR